MNAPILDGDSGKLLILVPLGLLQRVENIVRQTAERLCVSPDEARRLVEVAIVTRGIEAMECNKG